MTSLSTQEFGRLLLRGRIPRRSTLCCAQCLSLAISQRHRRPAYYTTGSATSSATSTANAPKKAAPTSLRKQIKEETKARKAAGQTAKKPSRGQTVPGWELTVGIEIHAQLNTERKLFSLATAAAGTSDPSSANDAPNSHVAYFDFSLPGAQPIFQPATVIPAIRAALALNCAIQPVSRFDRKHYFHWDQPSGYQITQYYEAFAKHGYINLYARDGIALEDGEAVRVDVLQVQMEQDTAKTIAQPGDVHWLDFNRVGVPLVEIITAPQIHHPATAAALVRKVQLLLRAVDACTAGMEVGGLRADVNVSVRRTDPASGKPVGPLGTRTEIKNLSSFRAVEDAIVAERNRQIEAIEQHELQHGGGDDAAASSPIVSETRGWAPGLHGGETHRLRGKEGEVDYRYMPDPDLGPVIIDPPLVDYLRLTMGVLPDAELDDLVAHYGLTPKDAIALTLLDEGGRAQYYYDVVAAFEERLQLQQEGGNENPPSSDATAYRSFVANWVLHQLGRLTSERNAGFGDDRVASVNDLEMTAEGRCRIPVACLADLLVYRYQGRITANAAKELLFAIFRGEIGESDHISIDDDSGRSQSPQHTTVAAAIDAGGLWFDEISPAEYATLASQALEGEEKTLKLFIDPQPKRYPHGKVQYLMGKLLRLGPEGRTDPLQAEAAVKAAIEAYVAEAKARQ